MSNTTADVSFSLLLYLNTKENLGKEERICDTILHILIVIQS